VSTWRQPQHDDPSRIVAETSDGFTPICFIAVRSLALAGHRFAPTHQPWTSPASFNLLAESYVRVACRSFPRIHER
jgi:hypothetical protein